MFVSLYVAKPREQVDLRRLDKSDRKQYVYPFKIKRNPLVENDNSLHKPSNSVR